MNILIRVAAATTPDHEPFVDLWLKSFDVDAYNGLGDQVFTDDPAQAMRFDGLEAALNAWKTQSKVRPLRPDGKPNRPLTAFSITFDTLPEAVDRG